MISVKKSNTSGCSFNKSLFSSATLGHNRMESMFLLVLRGYLPPNSLRIKDREMSEFEPFSLSSSHNRFFVKSSSRWNMDTPFLSAVET